MNKFKLVSISGFFVLFSLNILLGQGLEWNQKDIEFQAQPEESGANVVYVCRNKSKQNINIKKLLVHVIVLLGWPKRQLFLQAAKAKSDFHLNLTIGKVIRGDW